MSIVGAYLKPYFLPIQRKWPGIRKHLRRIGVKPNYLTVWRLSEYKKEHYLAINHLLAEFVKNKKSNLNQSLIEVIVPPLRNLTEEGITPSQIRNIPLELLDRHFIGGVLNLEATDFLSQDQALTKAAKGFLDTLMAHSPVTGVSVPIVEPSQVEGWNETTFDESGYDVTREQALWQLTHSEGTLEAKIGGAITDAHRHDFVKMMIVDIKQRLAIGQISVFEDAAGATPIVSLLLAELSEGEGAEKTLPQNILDRFRAIVRDFAPSAVVQAAKKIKEAGYHQVVTVEPGDMFEPPTLPDNSQDVVTACMAFYCTREKFRAALRTWVSVTKPGGKIYFSLKHKEGSLDVTRNETIKAYIKAIPWWQKILVLPALISLGFFVRQRKQAGAFEYAKALNEGFTSGRYYSPNEADLEADLSAVGLQKGGIIKSLADQFFLVSARKPE
ncbi:MAG: methyltransferase domain-containing protein [bacterium]